MKEALQILTDTAAAQLKSLSALAWSFFAQFQLAMDFYTLIIRWVFPILAAVILIRCVLPLFRTGHEEGAWCWLDLPNGAHIPIRHWENSIGRSTLCDVVVNFPSVSRRHAVLTLRDGLWTVFDLGAKAGVLVNGEKIEGSRAVGFGDVISLAGVDLLLLPPEVSVPPKPEEEGALRRLTRLGNGFSPRRTLGLIVIFQMLGALQLCFSTGGGASLPVSIPVSFLLLILTEVAYALLLRDRGRACMEPELLAFFLCGLGLAAAASAAPGALYKQLAALVLGLVCFSVLNYLLRDPDRARKLKYVLSAAALLLLAANLVIGQYRNGSRNWISLGFITFQPSEFVKVAFILAGTASLDRLLTSRNLTAFIAYSGVCVGALILMRDLGTALVFFGAFLVVALMRSGDVRTIAVISAAAALGAVIVVNFMPYIAARFSAWGHVWEAADAAGYQQTRTMMYAASGGLLGLGAGNGYLVGIPAADTDLVFGVLCEEWGLLVALTALLAFPLLALFSVWASGRCRSAVYAIAACGASAVFLMQIILNVFGSVDILPLTGVTFPFVSNGGSSMLASWCLLALIKSADERGRPEPATLTAEKGGVL